MRRVLPSVTMLLMLTLTLSSDIHAQLAVAAQSDRAPRFMLATGANAVPVRVDPARVPLLRERVTLDLQNVTLEYALKAIARQSNIRLVYSADVVPLRSRTSVKAQDISVAAALTEILLEANVDIVISGDQAALARRAPDVALSIPGVIVGTVTESGTNVPVVNAQIAVDGAGRAHTNEEGRYRVADVPPGRRSVSVTSIGYRSLSQEVEIGDGATVALDFKLEVSPSRLEAVVVTVTGEQRLRQMANVVGRINADSVVREAPVSSITELLNARVPGLQVLTTSGTVGGSVSLRIRGATTAHLSLDPIVIVDGIRYTSGHSNSTQGPWGVEPTSRINDLNPNEIESIEVAKGPSAAALYGTDAANGVIVITTKRGRAGPARWAAWLRTGISEVPDYRHPDLYWGWGSARRSCRLYNVTQGSCSQDSVTVMLNPLNDPELTIFGTAPRYDYGASVSGGGENLQYFLSAGFEDATGPVRLPPAFAEQLRAQLGGRSPPESQLEPNAYDKLNLRTNVTARVSQAADIHVSATYVQSDTRQFAIHGPYNMGARRMTPNGEPYGSYNPISSFAQSSTESINRFTGAVAGEWRVASWLRTRATVGLDFTSGRRYSLAPTDEAAGFDGRIGDDRSSMFVSTAELGATATHRLGALSSRTSLGAQYVRSISDNLTTSGRGLRPGGASVVDATNVFNHQYYSAKATLGSYMEQVFGLNDRLFVTGALRADGASTFGNDYRAAFYPKIGVSWIASEEPFIPRVPGVDEVRLRYAFGSSGQQPAPDMRRVTFNSGQGSIAGRPVHTVELYRLPSFGLRPERVREHEFGLDMDGLDRRLQLGITWNRRTTIDQITIVSLPTGLGRQWTNIGLIQGSGLEAQLAAKVIDSRALSLELLVTHATTTDKLVDRGGALAQLDRTGGLVEGYPIGARFMRPLLGYEDVNQDGIIAVDEVQMGDSAVYVGRSTPGQTQTFMPVLAFADRRIRLSGMFERRSDFVQFDQLESRHQTLSRAAVDPTAPLDEQARMIARYTAVPPGNATAGARYSNVNKGDFTRFRELSLSVDLPSAWAGIARLDRATLNLAARNIALWSSFSGPDPESARISGHQGGGAEYLPQARTWTLRLDIGF